ncbi:hypothetical protein ABENE_16815 [Asticcacaulis benevestitus DSM 16100 = ATCC BAA-896]|uniref:Uncharacterized protein n=1 Tax=Asticcacaulis benevestitus DSM 16100 = ATCC BAA-896 TaxID=1121022 RepID=V4PKN7_9CAUL|nr:hypothetical protein ABENE_16815 [Asticcacaulis benevestitus DSM 16100 = ATCC BAA-896]
MGIRLYDSAWVELDGNGEPCLVRKDPKNSAIFNVGAYQYDIDGRPLSGDRSAPAILRLHSLQSAREAGLRSEYRADVAGGLGQPFARTIG